MSHPKHILRQYNIKPQKSLGQNFLIDETILSRIVTAAGLTKDDMVIEVGAGIGNMTHYLALAAKEVIATEIDLRLQPILEGELAKYENVTTIYDDILNISLEQLDLNKYKVVANIPYYITGAILRHFLTAEVKPDSMILTVQKEVAERISAEPSNMSLLAVSVQFYATVSKLFTLKAGAFWPRPDIDSTVIRLDLHNRWRLKDEEEIKFFGLVKKGFSQRRKQLQKNLRNQGYSTEALLKALDRVKIDGKRRAETLTLDEWVELYRVLSG